jgi:hypothetical protein
VRPVDGLTGVAQLADASADVVVLDAYADGRVPAELTTVEFLADVSRVLRPDGTMLLNIADEPNKAYLRRVYAGLVAVFGQVALIGTHEILKGKRFGNTVAVASRTPLDIAALRRQVAKMPFPTGLRDGVQLARQFAGSAAVHDGGQRTVTATPTGQGMARALTRRPRASSRSSLSSRSGTRRAAPRSRTSPARGRHA